MKYQISLYFLLGLLVIALVGLWFFYPREAQAPAQVFMAAINRDCAPWDGSAFTVSIPLPDGSTMSISIYQSPDLKFPTGFSFPDETMREGNALLLLPAHMPEPLTGRVWFQRVQEGLPVEGHFQFRSEAGTRFEGKLLAEWGDETIYCG